MIRYLKKAVTAAMNTSSQNNASTTLTIGPPFGEWWAPRLIRIGTNINSVNNPNQFLDSSLPASQCTIFHGVTGDVNIDAFVDTTMNGAVGDVTSIMNGSLIQPGDTLTAQWVNPPYFGNGSFIPSAAIVYLEVIGLASDNINDLNMLSGGTAPGQRFIAQPPNALFPPQAGNNAIRFNFANPGISNTVNLLSGLSNTVVSLYELMYIPSALNANFYGDWVAINPTFGNSSLFGDTFSLDNTHRFQDFHGFSLPMGDGFGFLQQGTAALNTVFLNGGFFFRQLS